MIRFALALALAVSAFSLDASAQRGRVNGGYNGYGGGITVYEDPDFRGESVTFRDQVPDLREYELNDRISSLDVDGNQAWEVCRDVNYRGGCRVFQGTIEDLRSEGWNDRISSMRAVGSARANNNRGSVWGNPNGNRGGVWGNPGGNAGNRQSRLVLYDRPNFRGDARNVVNSAANLGNVGDRARSVQVYGGRWELCDGGSRNARCVTVDRDVPDLRSVGLRNGVTSAREVDSARGRWWQ